MKQKLQLAIISLFIVTFAASAQNKIKSAAPYFRMPANLTGSDYLPKTIVFKVKPEFRNACKTTSVENEKLNSIFNSIGAAAVAKIFPAKSAPAQERNAQGLKLVDLSTIYKIEFTADVNLEKTINRIIATGMVEYAEPFYVPHLFFSPNDPSTGLQYFLTKINAYLAWDVTHGDTNVVIGIVDTGTDWDHPDLADNLKLNYTDPVNGTDDDGDGYIDNYRGWDLADSDNNPMVGGNGNQAHGSHVSGCAAAATNNSSGVASPGFNCKFLPVKTSLNSDPNAYLVKGYEGIVYAADHGCSVINCSWGSGGGGQFGQDAVTYATINEDALVVCAAGNNASEGAYYPASYQYVISVASTGTNDGKSSFSNYGAFVDVCAPGSGIYSTYYNNTYAFLDGTSMASPIAAGSAAIIKSQFPSYNALQVGEKLRVTCDNIYGVAGNGIYQDKLGKGRINLFNALTVASPSVRFENKVSTDNNDDSFVIGDTINISGDFINYLDPTTNLTAALTTTSPYVTVLNGTYNIGALGTLATNNNSGSPFTVKVNTGAPLNAVVNFKLTLNDGTYSDVFLFKETVNVDYINITINDVLTTQTSKGQIFWNGLAQTEGLGFNYLGNQLVYDGGLMIGNNNQVSDNMRSTQGNFDLDFQSVSRVVQVIPSVQSEFDLYGKFNDNPAVQQLDVLVTHKTFAWSTPGDRKYIIVEYNIKNNGTSALSSLYAGIFADWDIMDYTLNRAAEDTVLNLGYVYSTQANGLYAGTKLLTSQPWHHYALDNIAGGAGGVNMYDDYTSTEKHTTLSTSRANAGTAGSGNDVCHVVGSWLFSLSAGDSITVAFAILAGDSLPDLITSAVNAQEEYDNLTGVHEISANGSALVGQLAAYPNPASDQLMLNFFLKAAAQVSLNIYNALGEEVYKMESKNFSSGKQSVLLNTQNFKNGIYFVHLGTDGNSVSQKITILK
ncbi:MAG TPA: S8/S53 family peptidase [Bacteroidia bacterium]|nr:S8/S53 family peptidase [Bacteroidia bacterium]